MLIGHNARCRGGAGKTNPMNERAMMIFEFGEKEYASEERKKKKG